MDLFSLFESEGEQPDGILLVSVSINETSRQFDIRVKKSLEIENESVKAMIENTSELLSKFMVLTKSQQRAVIDNCKNVAELESADQRPALKLVNINEA